MPAEGSAIRVAVLGSARLGPDDPAWSTGRELGRRLAQERFAVVTGGYGGLMGAVSRGAREAGGHVIGLPMIPWAHLTPNEWNVELRWAEDYPSRLATLLESRAVVALDGGVGTLSELAVVWSVCQTEPDAPVPVLLGERWGRIVQSLGRDLVVDGRDLALLRIVATPQEAVEAVLEAVSRPAAQPLGPRG